MKAKAPPAAASSAPARIRDAMIARGIASPAELARRLGVPRQTVHRWLNADVKNITHEHLFRLGDVLNISARWLALGDVDPSKSKMKSEFDAEVLEIYRAMSPHNRSQWLSIGRSLLSVETGHKPSRVTPFIDSEN